MNPLTYIRTRSEGAKLAMWFGLGCVLAVAMAVFVPNPFRAEYERATPAEVEDWLAEQDRELAERTIEITTTTVDRDGSDRFYEACGEDGRTHRSCPNHPRGDRCVEAPTDFYCPADPHYAEADAEALTRAPAEPLYDVWFINTDPIRDEPRYGTVEAWCDQWWDGLPAGAIEPLVFLRSAPTDEMLNAAAHVAVVQLITTDLTAADVEHYEHAVAWLDATCRPLYP